MSVQAQQHHKHRDQSVDLRLFLKWLTEAGEIALSQYSQLEPAFKSDSTPVTSADHLVEAYLIRQITSHYPGHQILSEEAGIIHNTNDTVWIIDPLDGTRAYASGLPIWGISVGVFRRGRPYLGAFLMPALREMYWGNNKGAFCNGKPIIKSKSIRFDDPLVFLAVPSNAHLVYEIDFQRVRSLGSVAAHLIYVARGAAIGALTRRIGLWDIAGVMPILAQAGIELGYLSGKPFRIEDFFNGAAYTEPLLAARHDLLSSLRSKIRLKESS